MLLPAPSTQNNNAWHVRFFSGSAASWNKDSDLKVRCVRGAGLTPSNLSRNTGTEIVTDWATGLEWQDDESVGNTLLPWEEAIGYCENTLTLGGWLDWRMPNINELFSIVDLSRRDPAINTSIFINTHLGHEWSSTTHVNDTGIAWQVFFDNGLLMPLGNKINAGHVRCVRGGEGGSGGFLPAIISYLIF